jgi:sorbitol-6-phosphate 2-dehydrogenase
MRTYAEVLSPLLRGLTYNGFGNCIVLSVEDKTGTMQPSAAVLVLSKPRVPVDSAGPSDLEAVVTDAISSFKRHSAEFSCRPAAVFLPGAGYFFMGRTYEEAEQKVRDFKNSGEIISERIEEFSGPGSGGEQGEFNRNSVVKNKIAVVTGGAQGFGAELVRGLVEAGALVFIADLNFEGASAMAKSLNVSAGRTAAFPVKVNVSDETSVEDMVSVVASTLGGIDLFVSNAGVLKAGSVKELSSSDFSFVTDVNYKGFFLCTKYASRLMSLQNRPTGTYYSDIIQINSKSGLEGSNRNGAYAGGKFGGIGLVQSFAMELVADNIKVNAICPGNFFDGPLWSDPDRGLFVQYLQAGKVPGAKSIMDVRKFYEEKVPMKRGCSGDDVLRALFYIVEQRYETGQAVPVTGGQVMLH